MINNQCGLCRWADTYSDRGTLRYVCRLRGSFRVSEYQTACEKFVQMNTKQSKLKKETYDKPDFRKYPERKTIVKNGEMEYQYITCSFRIFLTDEQISYLNASCDGNISAFLRKLVTSWDKSISIPKKCLLTKEGKVKNFNWNIKYFKMLEDIAKYYKVSKARMLREIINNRMEFNEKETV